MKKNRVNSRALFAGLALACGLLLGLSPLAKAVDAFPLATDKNPAAVMERLEKTITAMESVDHDYAVALKLKKAAWLRLRGERMDEVKAIYAAIAADKDCPLQQQVMATSVLMQIDDNSPAGNVARLEKVYSMLPSLLTAQTLAVSYLSILDTAKAHQWALKSFAYPIPVATPLTFQVYNTCLDKSVMTKDELVAELQLILKNVNATEANAAFLGQIKSQLDLIK